MPPRHHLSSRIWYRVSVSLCAHYPVSSHHYPLLFIYGSTRAFSAIVISMLCYRYPRSTVLSFHTFRPPSSSVQPVVPLSSLPRCLSPLESSFLRPSSSRLSTSPRLCSPLYSIVYRPPRSLLRYLCIPSTRLSCPFCGKASLCLVLRPGSLGCVAYPSLASPCRVFHVPYPRGCLSPIA